MLEGFFRSPRFIVRANDPTECGRYLLWFGSPAALLTILFEHPVEVLICMVHLISLVQPNKPDRPNRPNKQDQRC
jgi:hypothetical protein